EPEGTDEDLIEKLHAMAEGARHAAAEAPAQPAPVPVVAAPPVQPAITAGTLVDQVLERPLRPGEVSLDDLERAFRETAIEAAPAAAKPKPAKAERKAVIEEVEDKPDSKIANQSIRVNVETLESLMTMVSELVLTRNQLLEI